MNKHNENKFSINDIYNNNFAKLTPNQKEKEILKQVDHMKEFLTDKQNNNEMIKYFKMRKGNNIFFIKIYCFLKIKMRLIKILIYMELMMN